MQSKYRTRRVFTMALLAMPLLAKASKFSAAVPTQALITEFGAVADGATMNTGAIQAAIDHLAARGGGTVRVPPGVFVSGALFLKPKVDLHLAKGAVLKCSTDLNNFPVRRTRIEGHFEDNFNPGLINATACDGLKITGEGTLDGAGRPVWDLFWKLRNAAPDRHNFSNLGLPRARLAVIERSSGVLIDNITFKDSQFWNLHLYKCENVLVRNASFEVPDDYVQAPSTDGIDLDSCQNVTIDGCHFSVTDDCIAAKGSKGPRAMEDKDSPPVENIRVRNCVFKRGNGVMTLGSEATVVRDIVVENCIVYGVDVAVFKLRPDTPQHYENIHFRNLTLHSAQGKGSVLLVRPWNQYADLKGEVSPRSTVRNISFSALEGNFGSLGAVHPNIGQTQIGDIRFHDVDLRLDYPTLTVSGQTKVRFENVLLNDKQYLG